MKRQTHRFAPAIFVACGRTCVFAPKSLIYQKKLKARFKLNRLNLRIQITFYFLFLNLQSLNISLRLSPFLFFTIKLGNVKLTQPPLIRRLTKCLEVLAHPFFIFENSLDCVFFILDLGFYSLSQNKTKPYVHA